MRTTLATLCLLLALAPSSGAARAADDGHDRMVDLLAELAAHRPLRTAAESQVEQFAGRLFELRRALSDAQRLAVRRALGRAQLNNGQPLEALDSFEQMLREIRVLSAAQALPVAQSANFWLGVTRMRLAELDNCKPDGPPERCRFPITTTWSPGTEDWARGATEHLETALHLSRPASELGLAARWLLELAHAVLGTPAEGLGATVRLDPELFSATVPGVPRLADAADELGVAAPGLAGGALLEDLDGDGWLDLVVSTADLEGQLRVYRNESGRFADVTEESGLLGITGGHNLLQADYDGDGDLDVLVLRGSWRAGGSAPNSLLRNDGDFRFRDVTFAAGFGSDVQPTPTGAWADYDGDGDLDLFVASDAEASAGIASHLYRNEGGRFTDVATSAGLQLVAAATGAVWGDVDDDGWPDLFVAVHGGDNRLFRNQREGTFRDIAAAAGVTTPQDAQAAWFWDADGDGSQDLLVSSSRATGLPAPDIWYWYADRLGLPHAAEPLALYLGDGAGRFRDAGPAWEVARVTLSLGGGYGDVDNDGHLDFYLTAGYPSYESLVPDLLFRNVAGASFADATYTAGVGDLRRGSAAAFGDIDNDGDQDLFVKRGGLLPDDRAASSLFQNPGGRGHWLAIELRGTGANRFAVGARVQAHVREPSGRERILTRWVGSGAGPLRVHLGLGAATSVERLEVRWPGSERSQSFRELAADTRLLVVEGEAGPRTAVR